MSAHDVMSKQQFTIMQHRPGQITAHAPGDAYPAGRLDYKVEGTRAHVDEVHVEEEYRGRGVARSMYEHLHESHPQAVIHHNTMTTAGLGLARRLPSEWNHIPEGVPSLEPGCTAALSHFPQHGWVATHDTECDVHG